MRPGERVTDADTGRLRSRPEFEVLGSVVVADAVAVVDRLRIAQVAAEDLFGDQNVLEHIGVGPRSFDRVRPPRFPDDHDTGPHGMDDHGQAGFRVPTFALSPFAQPGHVNHAVYDHASMVKMVEWRFGLKPLTKRDRGARNLAESFDFSQARSAPRLPIVADPGPHVCQAPIGTNPMLLADPFWRQIAGSPLLRGWDAVR